MSAHLPQQPRTGGVVGASHGYIKIRDIGHGSYGKATLVQDPENKLYVMKTIDMSAMDKKQRRDAINEVRVLSCLKHPYIVSYRESFSENSVLAIVMDYADGGDLYQRISRTRKAGQAFGERQILRWFTEAALALKYMHDKHVLHRDLKSQNLFLTAADRLRVGDFGISKVLESTAAFAKTAIGTPYYLSPEICQEKPYSFASDMWALGCVLYEMATLRVPFDAPNLQALVQKITRGPLPAVPSHYSLDLRQLCGDLLHRESDKRPSATDVIRRQFVQDEIRRMLQEERDKATQVSSTSTPQPQHSQHPSSAGSALVDPSSASYRSPSPAKPTYDVQQVPRANLQPGAGQMYVQPAYAGRQGTPGRRY
mmetsp:Transcript_20087/g.46179  ORF Transcript_20087/g.46179 Transcript_20087/m.46179 type:complete len:368 (-) Transcript_20087:184-1287(-)